jgi:hypothetical protein
VFRGAILAAVLVLAAGCSSAPPAASPAAPAPNPAGTGPVLARTAAFEFHGGFWCDLHHFLYVVARGRLKPDDVVPAADEELKKTELSAADRETMESALAIYSQSFAKRDILFDDVAPVQSAIVARLESAPSLEAAQGLDPDVARGLELAAPVWRRAFWPRHSARLDTWLAEVRPILAKHSDAMVRGIENAYGIQWRTEPQRVDLVAHANWAGAYTVADPPRTTMSTIDPTYAGDSALEMLFHEASHTYDQQINGLLYGEARRQNLKIPRRLEHAVVFDTAGELAAAQIPGYVPVGERGGLYRKGEWFREPLIRIWHPHVAGRVPLADAVRDLVTAVGTR